MSGSEKEKPKKSAHEAAYSYLANRMRSVHELRCYLRDKGYESSEADDAIDELKEMGYLDDYQYALRYYEYNHDKRRGSLRAERELFEKGIDREIIRNAKEDYLFESAVDEYEDALAEARRALDGKMPDDKTSAKIARKLENKGYSRSDIFKVLDALRREDGD